MVMVIQPLRFGKSDERRSDRKVKAALLIALAVPIIAGIGCGLDIVRGMAVEARLAKAVNAAALAGSRVMSDQQRDSHIRSFFTASFPSGYLGSTEPMLAIADDQQAGTLTVRGRAIMHSVFLGLLQDEEITFEASSEVRLPGTTTRKGA